MGSNWTIENWNNTIAIKPTIFHNHNEYKVFVNKERICPLCKEELPKYLQFQLALLNGIYFTDEKIGLQKNGNILYSYQRKVTKFDMTSRKRIYKIEKEIIYLLEAYGFKVKK